MISQEKTMILKQNPGYSKQNVPNRTPELGKTKITIKNQLKIGVGLRPPRDPRVGPKGQQKKRLKTKKVTRNRLFQGETANREHESA